MTKKEVLKLIESKGWVKADTGFYIKDASIFGRMRNTRLKLANTRVTWEYETNTSFWIALTTCSYADCFVSDGDLCLDGMLVKQLQKVVDISSGLGDNYTINSQGDHYARRHHQL